MIRVCAVGELAEGEALRMVAGIPISVWNVGGTFYAIDDTCTHQDASLTDGYLEGCAVECPLHASLFDLRTGEVSGPPAHTPVHTHAVLVQDGAVYVRPGVPAAAPQAAS